VSCKDFAQQLLAQKLAATMISDAFEKRKKKTIATNSLL